MIDERLKTLIKMLTGKKNKFAREIGATPSKITNWTKGGESPNAEALIQIYEKFNVNINWLLTGKGEMFNQPEQKKTIQHYPEEKRQFFKEPCMWVLFSMIEKLSTDDRKKLIQMISVCFDQEMVDCDNNKESKEVKV